MATGSQRLALVHTDDDPPPVMYSLAGAARALSISLRTLRRRIDAGRIETVRDGRRRLIPATAIAAYAKALQREERARRRREVR